MKVRSGWPLAAVLLFASPAIADVAPPAEAEKKPARKQDADKSKKKKKHKRHPVGITRDDPVNLLDDPAAQQLAPAESGKPDTDAKSKSQPEKKKAEHGDPP